MQQKRYDIEAAVTVPSNGSNSANIENQINRKANFHGIRWCGRIQADPVSADNAARGWLVLMCHPASYTFDAQDFTSAVELEDASEWIIAVEPWFVYGGSSTQGSQAIYDFNIVPKSSRTCTNGGRLRAAIISFASSGKSVTATHLLSTFQTNT